MSKSTPDRGGAPPSLAQMQIDVTSRMGALGAATSTGLHSLDRLLNGGLRTGTLLAVSGGSGSGKTAFALLLAYMAARARAGVLFTSATLDETELLARLGARALSREQPELALAYGAIWSGAAWQDAALRGPVTAAVDTVVKKVGSHLHLHGHEPCESTSQLRNLAAALWARFDRVVVVVDGVQSLGPALHDKAPHDLEGRVAHVAQELARIAAEGCAVVLTVPKRYMDLVAPAATLSAELRPLDSSAPHSERALSLGARPVELVVTKNRLGAIGTLPLRFVPGISVFEERTP